MIPSISEDVTRVMRGQPKRLSRGHKRRNGGNVITYVLISFHKRDPLHSQSSFCLARFCARFCCSLFGRLFGVREFN